MVIASTPLAAKLTGTEPTACTASVWNGTANSAATAASEGMSWTVPTSLFAHMMLTSATASGSAARAARSVSGSTRPAPSTGRWTISAPCSVASHSAASRTA